MSVSDLYDPDPRASLDREEGTWGIALLVCIYINIVYLYFLSYMCSSHHMTFSVSLHRLLAAIVSRFSFLVSDSDTRVSEMSHFLYRSITTPVR